MALAPTDLFLRRHLGPSKAEIQEMLEFIGFDELMDADAIKLVEWPERAADRLPPPDLEITLRVEDEGRRVEVEAAR